MLVSLRMCTPSSKEATWHVPELSSSRWVSGRLRKSEFSPAQWRGHARLRRRGRGRSGRRRTVPGARVLLFHLVEELDLESVAELARWRRMIYEKNMQWAGEQLEVLTTPPGIGRPAPAGSSDTTRAPAS